MDASLLHTLATQFGPAGLIIGYLVWRESTTTKADRELARDRIAADKEMAGALASLKTVIETRLSGHR